MISARCRRDASKVLLFFVLIILLVQAVPVAASSNDNETKKIDFDDGSMSANDVSQLEYRSSIGQVLRKAGRKAVGGGFPGAVAGIVQVITLMW